MEKTFKHSNTKSTKLRIYRRKERKGAKNPEIISVGGNPLRLPSSKRRIFNAKRTTLAGTVIQILRRAGLFVVNQHFGTMSRYPQGSLNSRSLEAKRSDKNFLGDLSTMQRRVLLSLAGTSAQEDQTSLPLLQSSVPGRGKF